MINGYNKEQIRTIMPMLDRGVQSNFSYLELRIGVEINWTLLHKIVKILAGALKNPEIPS